MLDAIANLTSLSDVAISICHKYQISDVDFGKFTFDVVMCFLLRVCQTWRDVFLAKRTRQIKAI